MKLIASGNLKAKLVASNKDDLIDLAHTSSVVPNNKFPYKFPFKL